MIAFPAGVHELCPAVIESDLVFCGGIERYSENGRDQQYGQFIVLPWSIKADK